MEVARFAREARDVVLIGHAGHPEVEGTMGRFDTAHGGRIMLVENIGDVERLEVRDPARLAFVTQTTLSVDDTAAIVEALRAALSGCCRRRARKTSATRRRTARMRSSSCSSTATCWWWWARSSSSNSNRLRELADRAGIPGYLVDGAERPAARMVRRTAAPWA